MDPNANVREQFEIIRTARQALDNGKVSDPSRLRELREALAAWRTSGGFAPEIDAPTDAQCSHAFDRAVSHDGDTYTRADLLTVTYAARRASELRISNAHDLASLRKRIELLPSYPLTGKERASFIRGYTHTMMWTALVEDHELFEETGETGSEAYAYGFDNLDTDAREIVERDCDEFIMANAADVAEYAEQMDGTDPDGGDGWGQAGHDFYLTREGHGTGFWDRDLGPLGDRLAEAARAFGETMHIPTLADDGETVTFG